MVLTLTRKNLRPGVLQLLGGAFHVKDTFSINHYGLMSAVTMAVGWRCFTSVVLLDFLEFQLLPERKIDRNCFPEASLCASSNILR